MKKGLAFVSIAVAVGAVVVVMAACDDSAASNFDESANDSGGPIDTGPGFQTDGGAPADTSAPVSCSPALPVDFQATWKPPTKADACTATEIAEYYDKCVQGGEDAGPGCKSWRDAHADCMKCLEPADNNGPVQFYHDRYYYGLNVAGCMAILRNEVDAGTCPAAYSDSFQCQRDSCDDCLLQEGAQFSDFQKCQAASKTTGCKTYEEKRIQACGTGFALPDGGAYECFRPKDEKERAHVLRLGDIFCGK